MATDINSVTLIGRLTRDAELTYTNSGTALCKFSLAVNRKRKSGDQWIDEVSFFDITLWGKQGEAIQQYMSKGKQIAVDGYLKQDRWEKDGQNRSKVAVVASNVQLLGGGRDSNGGNSGNQGNNQNQGQQNRNQGGQGGQGGFNQQSSGGPEDFEDEIPF